MADRTITVNSDKTASMNGGFLAIQGEEITVDVVLHASLWALGYDGYVDFLLPDGKSYFKGGFDCSTGTLSFTLGALDSILDMDGKVEWQVVLAETVGAIRTDKWKTKMYETEVLPSIGSTSSAILPYVPQMVYPTQYPAANVSVADVPGNFIGTDAEAVLSEIAGTTRSTEKLSDIGLLANLLTTAKTTIVAAINELFTSIGLKAPLASPTFTGSVIIPAPTADMNPTTRKYVTDNAVFKTGDQTIAGIKTFSSTPVLPTETTSPTLAAGFSGTFTVKRYGQRILVDVDLAHTSFPTGLTEVITSANYPAWAQPSRVLYPPCKLGVTSLADGTTITDGMFVVATNGQIRYNATVASKTRMLASFEYTI